MQHFILNLFSFYFALSIAQSSLASTDCTCIVYQPIDMRSEGTVIRLPTDGFMIFPVPFISGFSIPETPYNAITRPFYMLHSRDQKVPYDSNLTSRAEIKIDSNCIYEGKGKDAKFKKEVVTVDISKCIVKEYDQSLETTLEATLECIRRTATDEHQQWKRPELKIVSKPEERAKWKIWEAKFNNQDFSKPFKFTEAVKK